MTKLALRTLWSRTLSDLMETQQLAQELARQLKPKTIIGLQGEMGSGKTHFALALAQSLGCTSGELSSPTYAIHQEYQGPQLTLHHLDLYRLDTEDEIESSGFWDLFYDETSIIVVEWIDRIPFETIPQNFSYIRLDWKIKSDGTRSVTLSERISLPPSL